MQTWEAVRYRLVDVDDDRINAVTTAVARTHVNGGMIVGCIAPCLAHEFDAAMSFDRDGEWRPAQSVLTHPIILEIDPKLRIDTDVSTLSFARLGRYALEGEITQIIRSNGAYRKSDVADEDARNMSRNFVDALSSPAAENLIAYRTYDYRAEWFCDVAWDVTLIVLDSPARRWWVVCVTDTD